MLRFQSCSLLGPLFAPRVPPAGVESCVCTAVSRPGAWVQCALTAASHHPTDSLIPFLLLIIQFQGHERARLFLSRPQTRHRPWKSHSLQYTATRISKDQFLRPQSPGQAGGCSERVPHRPKSPEISNPHPAWSRGLRSLRPQYQSGKTL